MDPLSPEAQEELLEELIMVLHHQRGIADYVFITALALWIYDYLLTVQKEITLMWPAPWSYTKVMYMVVRYLPIMALGFNVQTQLTVGVSAETCRWTYPVVTWLIMPSLALAEIILMIRTWAVWKRNRTVGGMLVVALVATLFTACFCNVKFLKSLKLSDPPIPNYRGCFVTGANDIMKTAFIFLACIEAFVLSLMIISAYKAYKEGNRNQLMIVIHRDGVLFYIYLLCLTTCNVCVMALAPKDLLFMLTPVCCTLYSVFVARIVLNIRDVARGTEMTHAPSELHGYHKSEAPIPLSYRPNILVDTSEQWTSSHPADFP